MCLVPRDRQALSDRQEGHLYVGGVCVLNGDWEEGRIYKNAAGELVVVENKQGEKLRA